MPRSISDVSPWAVRALYLFALVLILSPLIDYTTSVVPARPGDIAWRYGALGLLPGFIHTPMLGLVLGMGVAYWRGHPRMMQTAGVLAGLASLGALLAMAVFALDVVQMRAMRPDEAQAMVLASGVLQEVKYLLSFIVLAPMSMGARRTAATMKKARGAGEGPGIVARGSSA